jgi:hypothetical protein
VVAKIRERIAVNKQGSHKFHMERFNLKKLNDLEGKEKYRVEVSNRFAALEDLDAEVEINTIWETIRENIKISAKESLGYHEPSSISHDLMKDAQNYWIRGNKLNCSGYRIQMKSIAIT